jgi:hypothetical protein
VEFQELLAQLDHRDPQVQLALLAQLAQLDLQAVQEQLVLLAPQVVQGQLVFVVLLVQQVQ